VAAAGIGRAPRAGHHEHAVGGRCARRVVARRGDADGARVAGSGERVGARVRSGRGDGCEGNRRRRRWIRPRTDRWKPAGWCRPGRHARRGHDRRGAAQQGHLAWTEGTQQWWLFYVDSTKPDLLQSVVSSDFVTWSSSTSFALPGPVSDGRDAKRMERTCRWCSRLNEPGSAFFSNRLNQLKLLEQTQISNNRTRALSRIAPNLRLG